MVGKKTGRNTRRSGDVDLPNTPQRLFFSGEVIFHVDSMTVWMVDSVNRNDHYKEIPLRRVYVHPIERRQGNTRQIAAGVYVSTGPLRLKDAAGKDRSLFLPFPFCPVVAGNGDISEDVQPMVGDTINGMDSHQGIVGGWRTNGYFKLYVTQSSNSGRWHDKMQNRKYARYSKLIQREYSTLPEYVEWVLQRYNKRLAQNQKKSMQRRLETAREGSPLKLVNRYICNRSSAEFDDMKPGSRSLDEDYDRFLRERADAEQEQDFSTDDDLDTILSEM